MFIQSIPLSGLDAANTGVTASTVSAASAGNRNRGADLSSNASRKLLYIVVSPLGYYLVTGWESSDRSRSTGGLLLFKPATVPYSGLLFFFCGLDDHDRSRGQSHNLFRLGTQHGMYQPGSPLTAHDNHAGIDFFRCFQYPVDR